MKEWYQSLRVPKPIRRSRLRLWLGKRWHILRRRLRWWFGDQRFARQQQKTVLPHRHFAHSTPLRRRLKDVDMWMQENKVRNLEIALRRLDGLVIAPGETFSYWRRIGKPNKAKGYLPGMQLVQGKVEAATGGGLCQLSNLIFWMALHSPLTVVERWRHSYDVFPDAGRKLPFGSGATCSYNYIDLQLKNETEAPIQLKLWLSEEDLHGELRGPKALPHHYEVYEEAHCFQPHGWGFTRHNKLARRVLDSEENLVRIEPILENHAICMYNPSLPERAESGQSLS